MAKFKDVLVTNTGIPAAVETKFPMLPKLSAQMVKVANALPDGMDLPEPVVKILTPPSPAATGQPLSDFFKGPPITGPEAIMSGRTSTRAEKVSMVEYKTTPALVSPLTPEIITRRGM